MPAPVSIFLDFNLPNATTWFYFSLLLAVALFFKFSRLVSVRNLDVMMLFLLTPGLLLVLATRPQPAPPEHDPGVQIAALIGSAGLANSPGALSAQVSHLTRSCGPALANPRWLWYGYLGLLVGSIIFFGRCLFDLALAQRPALAPNLQTGGLVWLAGAFLICLLAVAYRQVERHANPLPIVPGSAAALTPLLHPAEQNVFAVAILWRDWPAWAVAALAFAGHTTVVVLLVLIAWRHFQDLAAGMAAATFYLLLPYTGAFVGQVHHVLPMALFLGTFLVYRYPTWTGALLGLAAGATYFPVFALPIWLSFYRQNGAGRFLGAFLLSGAVCLAHVGFHLWLHGELDASINLARDAAAWQAWKSPTTEGFWIGIHWAYRIPVFLLFLSFVLSTTLWPAPKNLAHVIALSAASFVSLQFWGADQGGVYVLWYAPLLLLLVFRPNLQDRVAVPIDRESDWLARTIRAGIRLIRRVFKLREPAATDAVTAAKNGGHSG
ncbi:MAG: hypothetical protein HYX68_17890 [Planctomycetes bacterium]|nr:hypothetical protein [Planctomycetota bacterium]